MAKKYPIIFKDEVKNKHTPIFKYAENLASLENQLSKFAGYEISNISIDKYFSLLNDLTKLAEESR